MLLGTSYIYTKIIHCTTVMKSSEIRQSFLDFFTKCEHLIVPSSSLMPSSPNLLFTNSGMNQFVPYFLAERTPPAVRIADTQKCIRAGGKHNDLDDVGYDGYHHTFFEMLGNWSFGDYFKKESLPWAWELLTKVWGLPKNRLYATVYKPGAGDPAEFDQEAYDIWKDIFVKEGMNPEKHIVYGNRKDNFWMMGDTGPCGPCSEIHIDLTPDAKNGEKLVNTGSPWCIELWNLVFIQFNAKEDGTFVPLAAKHVDTGMGFERVAGVIATTKNFTDFSKPTSNYNCDLFTDIFACIEKMSGHKYSHTLPDDRDKMSEVEKNDCIFRVLADHIRTLSFAIADGIMPGNEGRNYVLRRILRRAVMYGKRLNLPLGFFPSLVEPLVKKMGDVFPGLRQRQHVITRTIENEERAFERTLDRGLAQLESYLKDNPGCITGEQAFVLYDTYGFPCDLTEIIAKERGVTVDSKGFEEQMELQRERARAAQKKSVITVCECDESGATEFVGYHPENLSHYSTTVAQVIECEGDSAYLVFPQTPFYAEMGGQVGDAGIVHFGSNHDKKIIISNTTKDANGCFLHHISKRAVQDQLKAGDEVELSVDLERRAPIQRHHTATHLLHWALHTVLGDHIKQAGSLVETNYLRFDFSHYEALTPMQIQQVETLVNKRILENAPVRWFETPFDQKPTDVIAFFGDKYGNIVRVVDVGGYSKELCGGTHVQATGEIGLFKIVSESAISAGTRRIEAVCGEAAFVLAESNYNLLASLAHRMSCKANEIPERFDHLLETRNTLQKKLRSYEQQNAAGLVDQLITKAFDVDAIKVVCESVEVANIDDMRSVGIQIAKRIGASLIILASVAESSKGMLMALASSEAIEAGFKAGDVVRNVTSRLEGKGGGKPDFAMGGFANTKDLDSVLTSYRQSLTHQKANAS